MSTRSRIPIGIVVAALVAVLVVFLGLSRVEWCEDAMPPARSECHSEWRWHLP